MLLKFQARLRPKIQSIFRLNFTAIRYKSTAKPKCIWGRVKVASKRKLKNYKLKTHKGAASRWKVMANGNFKRLKAGRNRLNRKNNARKKIMKRLRVRASSTEKRLLKKLMPYHRKAYMK